MIKIRTKNQASIDRLTKNEYAANEITALLGTNALFSEGKDQAQTGK